MKIHYLKLPLTPEQVENLALGDMVYLTGDLIMTAGIPTHERIVQYMEEDKELPIDMKGQMLLHFGGYNYECVEEDSKGEMKLRYLNPTTSTRFNAIMPKIIRGQHLTCVGGKGGLSSESAKAMAETGCVYLSFPGGLATLYTQAIRKLKEVAWTDFILHYRLVKLEVENLGPGTVGIDAHGNSLYDDIAQGVEDKMPEIMAGLTEARNRQH